MLGLHPIQLQFDVRDLGRFSPSAFVGGLMVSEVTKARAWAWAYDLENSVRAPADPNRQHVLDEPKFSCRYCGRSKPEVSFGKTAHVLAQALSNHRIVSLFECDACNAAFAECEADLVASLGPALAVVGVEGKNRRGRGRRPTYTSPVGGHRIRRNDRGFIVEYRPDRPGFTFDVDAGTVAVDAPPARYVPAKVFRALYKAAMAVLPASTLRPGALQSGRSGYGRLATAVNPHGPLSLVTLLPAMMLSHVLPGPREPRTAHATIDLFCRRPPFAGYGNAGTEAQPVPAVLPSRMAVVRFGIHVLQLPLFSDLDALLLESGYAKACVLPLPILLPQAYVERDGVPSSEFVDLSSTEPVEPRSRWLRWTSGGEPVSVSLEESRRMIEENRTPFD